MAAKPGQIPGRPALTPVPGLTPTPGVDLRAVSAAGAAAGAAVQALARAARSFVLYDPGNTVIQQLLEAWRTRALEALANHGELALEVRPFDVALRGEVVYQDPDREKSLAFKLFRDGVRRLTLGPATTWEELLRLLEAVALRYTAVRQQEDDVVTLLRRADLKGIQIVAVEGFVPAEERPEPGADDEAAKPRGAKPAEGWDTPLPRLPAPGPIAFRPLPTGALEGLRASESDEALATAAMGLASDLLAEAVRGGWPRPNADLVAFFAELRDYLLAEGRLAPLRQLVEIIGRSGAGEVREEILSGLGNARTLDLVLAAVPEGAVDLPEDLIGLVPLLGFAAALDRLEKEADERRRALLLKLVLARLPREADTLLHRLPSLEPGLARALARGLVSSAPQKAVEVARFLLGQKDQGLRIAGLESLAEAPGEIPIPPVMALLDDPSEAIRVKAVEVLGRRGDEGTRQALLRSLETGDRSPREVEALGRALAEISPVQAGRLLLGWLHPKGRFLVGTSTQQKRLQWAAVAGLALVPGEEAERQLQALAQEADEELRRHCLASLARRRKGRGHG